MSLESPSPSRGSVSSVVSNTQITRFTASLIAQAHPRIKVLAKSSPASRGACRGQDSPQAGAAHAHGLERRAAEATPRNHLLQHKLFSQLLSDGQPQLSLSLSLSLSSSFCCRFQLRTEHWLTSCCKEFEGNHFDILMRLRDKSGPHTRCAAPSLSCV